MGMSRLEDTRLGRALRWPPRGRYADALVVVGCLLVSVLSVLPEEKDERALLPEVGWAMLVVACSALYFRRRHPIVVAVVVLVACGLYFPLTEPDGLVIITLAIALYTAAAEGHLVAAAVVAGVGLAATAYGNRGDASHIEDAAGFLLVGWFVAVIAIGGVVRNRRAYLREADERARVAERGRELEARRRAIEERLRIARELHDVLGHNISLINVQATAALHGLRREPERAEDALTAIKQASKDTLREMRATLGVLRQVDEAAPVAPAPGLARLDELTDGITHAGLTVRTETEGEPRPLPTETDLAAYRIVQEALTNVTRHSNASEATVTIRYGETDVVITVDDNGATTTAPAEDGTGIRGMRDRTKALGGTLAAAPRPKGGFTVRARLPA